MKSHPSFQHEHQQENNNRSHHLNMPPPMHFMPPFNHLIKQLLDENQILNKKMSESMLMELSSALKIEDNYINDMNDRLNKIKGKLMDIFIDEKDEWGQYLKLPKFKPLTGETKKCLNTLMKNIWDRFQNQGQENTNRNKCLKYTCTAENPKDIEHFHCSMFNFIKCGYFGEAFENAEMFRPMNNFSMMPRNNEFPYPPHPNIVQSDLPYQEPDHYYPPNYSKVKVEEGFYNPNINNPSYNPMMFPKGQNLFDPIPKQQFFYNQNTENKSSKQQSKKQSTFTPYNKNFAGCVCKGRLNEEEIFFTCKKCNRKFHLKCFGIPADAEQKSDPVCPQCSLQCNNIFYETIGEPLDIIWTDDRQLHKQKITIKSRKCQQITANNQMIQLRFVKIDGKNYFNYYDPDGKSLPNGKIILNEIFIKKEMLSKNNNEDIKISLDCMKLRDKGNESPKKPILLFFINYVVRNRTKDQILKLPFEDVEDDYLDRFLGSNEQIKIEIIDNDIKLINTPVRGIDCDHCEVIDLQEFVKHCIELSTENCYICNKKCRNFKIDRKIANEIAKIREHYEDSQKFPNEIYYSRNGFRWPVEQEHENQMAPDDNISHESMSLSMSQEQENKDSE